MSAVYHEPGRSKAAELIPHVFAGAIKELPKKLIRHKI